MGTLEGSETFLQPLEEKLVAVISTLLGKTPNERERRVIAVLGRRFGSNKPTECANCL